MNKVFHPLLDRDRRICVKSLILRDFPLRHSYECRVKHQRFNLSVFKSGRNRGRNMISPLVIKFSAVPFGEKQVRLHALDSELLVPVERPHVSTLMTLRIPAKTADWHSIV